MKVIGLISGGKDSCYNLMLCEKYGHEIVALGNLIPNDTQCNDIDSYMYQTVGHQLIEKYALCTGLKLFRKKIRGKSLNLNLSYNPITGDEVEDLYELLYYIKETIPEVEAVASGAIASNYQRLRIEHICSRLGLISLSYLWMQPQDILFENMIKSQIKAILIKVACLGLIPDLHLGKKLEEMKNVLWELNKKYGCNICGEGGEYESLVCDCSLFKYGRIVIDEFEIIKDKENSDVGIYLPSKYHVEPKSQELKESQEAIVINVPENQIIKEKENLSIVEKNEKISIKISKSISLLKIKTELADIENLELNVNQIFLSIKDTLEDYKLKFSDCIFVQVYISDIKWFNTINKIYTLYFPATNPASRVCLELKSNYKSIQIDILINECKNSTREILHVQSISHWAPCCIGPYSQANLYNDLIFCSGILGFDAPVMLLSGNLMEELKLALNHCQAISIALNSNFKTATLTLVVYLDDENLDFENFGNDIENLIRNFKKINKKGNLEYKDVYLSLKESVFELDMIIWYLGVSKLPKGAKIEIEPVILNLKRSNTEIVELDNYIDLNVAFEKILDDFEIDIIEKKGNINETYVYMAFHLDIKKLNYNLYMEISNLKSSYCVIKVNFKQELNYKSEICKGVFKIVKEMLILNGWDLKAIFNANLYVSESCHNFGKEIEEIFYKESNVVVSVLNARVLNVNYKKDRFDCNLKIMAM